MKLNWVVATFSCRSIGYPRDSNESMRVRGDVLENKHPTRRADNNRIQNTKGLITDYTIEYQCLGQSVLFYFGTDY